MRIKLLDPLLTNQIAAGEVIERPASVVKELLENSLDAGAQKIEIDIEKGGMQLIRIRDDGGGIHQEDLALALQRHATSKIKSLNDLENVLSLGFRGEALASIGSVARVNLSSHAKGADKAWQVLCEGREGGSDLAPVAHPPGTSIEVRDLFFNTPARRRFLRSEKTEFEHIHEVVKRVILSRFDVAFILRHNQRVIYQLPAAHSESARDQRIGKVCGAAFFDKALYLDMQRAGLHIWGWLGLPEYARSQADLQYFYVNGRMIKDRVVNHALRQAYAELLYPGKYASYVLFLELTPSKVDVNVHPTKHEVRFHDGRLVHDFLQRSIEEALQTPTQQAELVSATEPRQTVTINEPSKAQENITAMVAPSDSPLQDKPSLFPQSQRSVSGKEQMAVYQRLHTPAKPPAASAQTPTKLTGPLGRSLRVAAGYLLAENKQGLVLVDLTHAWKTITLQRWQQALADSGIRRQPLLVPLSLTVSEQQAKMVELKSDLLKRLGLDIQCVGPKAILVRQIPSLLAGSDVSAWCLTLIDRLDSFANGISNDQLDTLLQLMLHTAGVTATAELSLEACDNLLREIESLGDEAARYYKQLSHDDFKLLFTHHD